MPSASYRHMQLAEFGHLARILAFISPRKSLSPRLGLELLRKPPSGSPHFRDHVIQEYSGLSFQAELAELSTPCFLCQSNSPIDLDASPKAHLPPGN